MISHTEFRRRVCTHRDIHLRRPVNVVFTWYLQCRPSPVPMWRRGRSGSSSCLFLFALDHLPYSSSFIDACFYCVFSLLQKFFVWFRRCRSLPYFSIPSSSTKICLSMLFPGGFDMLLDVSLFPDATYFCLLPLLAMVLLNSACCLTMFLNCM